MGTDAVSAAAQRLLDRIRTATARSDLTAGVNLGNNQQSSGVYSARPEP